MTTFGKLKETAKGLIMMIIALDMISSPAEGYTDIIYIFAIYFSITGIGMISYYISMARHMVDGRTSLFYGIIMLDLGILTFTLTDVPHFYVLIYLIAIHAFSGVVEVLRALEARRLGAGSWKLKMCHGMVDIIMAAVCIVFIRKMSVAVIIYGTGLIYSSVLRIVSAFRKTKLVFIQ